MPSPQIIVLGVNVSSINMSQTLHTIDQWIDIRAGGHYVCVTGVHGVMECQRDPELLTIHNRADLVTPDGMPLVWLNRLAGQRHVSRVYGPDLMLALCEHSIRPGYRHFLYGGANGIPEKLTYNLTRRFPGLQIVGHYSPPFRPLTPDEDADVIAMINASQADIVWVGLSTPKQERWMAAHVEKLMAPVLIGVGAAFDFHAGVKKQAPRWMQHNGLEWFFRLVTEPRRLGPRYLVNNPKFIWYLLLAGLGWRKPAIEQVNV